MTSDTFPKESYDLTKHGLEIYRKMTKTWMEMVDLSSKDKPEDVMKSWLEALASANKDIFGMFTKTLRMPDLSVTPGNAKWEDMFNSLQKSLAAYSFDATPPFKGTDDFIEYSSGWQERYNKFVFTWIECLQKMAGSCKAGNEGKALAEYLDSSEEFLNNWSSFMTEQTRTLFQLWKASVIKAKKAAEKKGPEKKEESKKRAPRKRSAKKA